MGDSGLTAKELLDKVSDLELKCRALQKALNEKYFISLPKALEILGLTMDEYIKFTTTK